MVDEDSIACSECSGVFHYNCQGMGEATFRKIGSRKSRWKCSHCRATAKNLRMVEAPVQTADESSSATSAIRGPDLEPTNYDIIKMIAGLRDDYSNIMKEFQALKASIENNGATLASLNDRTKAMESTLESKIVQMDTLERSVSENKLMIETLTEKIDNSDFGGLRVDALHDEVVELKNTIKRLSDENNDKDQYVRMNNIEISGIPRVNGESLMDILMKIANKLDISLDGGEVDFLRRVASWSNHKLPPKIVVRFHNRNNVENFLSAIRKRKGLSLNEIGYSGTDAKVFVNYHLTTSNKLLYKKTKEIAKNKLYQFFWIKRCRIYTRKDEKSPAILVRRESDLSKIK
jgi:predicted  nucleic acid-binding Zn-ribbon protein